MQVERRRCVGGATSVSKAKVTLDDLRDLEVTLLESPPFPVELKGCSGASVHHLLGKATAGFGVISGDEETEKIDYADLAKGVLVHSGPGGRQPLEADMGGPLRIVFPAGVALQADEEGGTASPADVRDVRLLSLTT